MLTQLSQKLLSLDIALLGQCSIWQLLCGVVGYCIVFVVIGKVSQISKCLIKWWNLDMLGYTSPSL